MFRELIEGRSVVALFGQGQNEELHFEPFSCGPKKKWQQVHASSATPTKPIGCGSPNSIMHFSQADWAGRSPHSILYCYRTCWANETHTASSLLDKGITQYFVFVSPPLGEGSPCRVFHLYEGSTHSIMHLVATLSSN